MTRLNIMISKGLGIILHIVDYIGSHVSCLGVDVIIIVAGRLSLQDIAILQEDEIVLIGLCADRLHRRIRVPGFLPSACD